MMPLAARRRGNAMVDSDGHFLMGLDGSVEGRRFELGTGVVKLGRGPDCQVRLANPRVSKDHARITAIGGSYTLEDLGSVNGTTVNGLAIGKVVLRHGDRIQLGDTTLEYQAPGTAARGETRPTRICSYCGRGLDSSAVVCPGCGAPRSASG
jgi:pSer/pThr/pTyr-binding forkhead associated (FHA) protein